MQDPVMQSILQQAQSDPAALQEHMKNPAIRSKVQKLIVSHLSLFIPRPLSTCACPNKHPLGQWCHPRRAMKRACPAHM